MGDIFARDYTGGAFELLGVPHLVGLAVIALINLALITGGRRLSERARRRVRYGLAGVLLVTETSWHVWNIVVGMWTVQTLLPLHLCSILIWLSAVMLLTENYTIYEFVYFMGIGGALQALLTPDAGIYGFPHYRFFEVLVSHGALVTSGVYMTVVEGFRPVPRSLVRVFVGSNLYMALVGIVNTVLGSNYLFVARKPETASLLDVLPPWPWYIPVLELIGLVTMALLYAPFALYDLRAGDRPASDVAPVGD